MNRCKDCKYFKRNTDKFWSNKYGVCECNKFIYGSSCDENIVKNTDQLLYEDSEGYAAGFEVGQDFGCIHFKERRGEYE